MQGNIEEKKIKMAYVDVNYILSHSKELKNLKIEKMKQDKELNIWISKINTLAMEKETNEEQKLVIDRYNLELSQKRLALNEENNLKLQQIDSHITALIAKEAKNSGYDYVFAKGTLLFGGEDITLKIAEKIVREEL